MLKPLTPAQANYQPLQLENFAQPLAQMQQRYDTVVNAFEDSEFGISGLSPDSERGQKLSQKLAADRDEVLEELQKTKNYKQAARRLKKLNKVYNEDPEIAGIRSQKAAFDAENERMKKRLEKDDITETDYRKWKNYTLGKYAQQGGYSYDRLAEEGKGLYIPTLEDNLEPDIMEAFDAAAKGAPANVYTSLQPLADKFGISEGQIESVLEIKDPKKLTEELINVFSQSDNFRDYYNNKAEFEWFDRISRNPDYAEEVVKNQFGEINSAIAEVQNNPKLNEKEKAERLEYLNTAFNNLKTQTQEATASGQIQKLGEDIFKSRYAGNKIKELSGAFADLYDYEKTDYSTKGYAGDSGKSKALNKVAQNNARLNFQIVPTTANEGNLIAGGTSPVLEALMKKSYEDGKALELHERTAEINQSIDVIHAQGDMPDSEHASLQALNFAESTLQQFDVINDEITSTQEELENINTRLRGKISPGEANKLKADGDKLEEKLNILKIDKQNRFNSLEDEFATDTGLTNNLISIYEKNGLEAVQKYIFDESQKTSAKYAENKKLVDNNIDKEIGKFVSEYGGVEGYINSKSYLPEKDRKALLKNEEYVNTLKEMQQAQDGENSEQLALAYGADYDPNKVTPGVREHTKELVKKQGYKDKLASLEKEILHGQEKINPDIKAYTETMSNWENKMNVRRAPSVIEIRPDENFVNFVGEDEAKPILEDLENLKSGDVASFNKVKFNTSTGEIEDSERMLETKVDREYYNLDSPRLLGQAIGPNGQEQTIFKIARDKMSNDEIVKNVLGLSVYDEEGGLAVVEHLNTIQNKPTLEERQAYVAEIENPEVKAAVEDAIIWQANNPEEITISTKGYSASMHRGAKETMTQLVDQASKTKDLKLMKGAISSFARLDLLMSGNLRKDYNEMSVTLKQALENEDPEMNVTLTPHTFKDNRDGTRTGNVVQFTYSPDLNKMVAVVKPYTIDADGNPTKRISADGDLINEIGASEVIPLNNLNDVSALREISLFYGAGDINRERIEGPNGSYVPAFLADEQEISYKDMINSQ